MVIKLTQPKKPEILNDFFASVFTTEDKIILLSFEVSLVTQKMEQDHIYSGNDHEKTEEAK